MSEEETNDSQASHQDGIDDINSVYNPTQVGEMGAIFIPQAEGKAIYEVTSTTLHLLQIRGLYRGLDHEDLYEHVRNFTEVCSPFSFKNVSQQSIRLWLFPLSLTGEANKWLAELPNNTITSWEELVVAFNTRFFPPSRMMKLRD